MHRQGFLHFCFFAFTLVFLLKVFTFVETAPVISFEFKHIENFFAGENPLKNAENKARTRRQTLENDLVNDYIRAANLGKEYYENEYQELKNAAGNAGNRTRKRLFPLDITSLRNSTSSPALKTKDGTWNKLWRKRGAYVVGVLLLCVAILIVCCSFNIVWEKVIGISPCCPLYCSPSAYFTSLQERMEDLSPGKFVDRFGKVHLYEPTEEELDQHRKTRDVISTAFGRAL